MMNRTLIGQAKCGRIVEPFWLTMEPDSRYDLAILRPASLRRGQRFETVADADEYTARHVGRLRELKQPWSRRVARVISRCEEVPGEQCGQTLCSQCGRGFRRWLSGEVLRVNDEDPRSKRVVTVLLASVRRRDLPDLAIKPFHDLLRKRLKRAGLTDVTVIGGLEAAWKASKRRFVLHAHLYLLGATDAMVGELRKVCRRSGFKKAIKDQSWRRPATQASYLFKINSIHRPGDQSGARKPRAYPLPDRAFVAWAAWLSTFRFEDLLFLSGARRRGACIAVRP